MVVSVDAHGLAGREEKILGVSAGRWNRYGEDGVEVRVT